ncbi:MAG: TonB-dependent receptor [Methylophaga sp.]
MQQRVISMSIALAALGNAYNAYATEEAVQLNDIVVSASGYEQKVTEAPASISVITREQLQQKRFANLGQALEDVEGIDVRQGTGKTGGLNISIRGLPSDYTLVLIDGRRQNAAGSVTPNGFNETSNTFMPPLSAIERIEVIRGPMSTLYGSDAMGGVINIITRAVAKEWGTSLTLDKTLQEDRDYGDTSMVSLYSSGPIIEDVMGVSLRGNLHRRDGSELQFEDGSDVNRRGAAPVEGQNYTIGAKLAFTPNAHNEWAIDVERGRQVYENDDCQLGTLDGFGGNGVSGCTTTNNTARGYSDELRFERDQVALLHTGDFSFGKLTSSLMHNQTETLGRTLPGTLGADIGIAGSVGGSPRELVATNLIFDTKLVSQLTDQHRLSVGSQWWDAELEDGIAFDKFEQTSYAFFAEDEWRFREDMALTLGARYENHDAFGSQVSPRAYLVWNTTDYWTMKGGVSRGYKTPSLEDLHDGINGVTGQGTVLTIGSPDLEPEETTNTEIGVYFDNFADFNFNITAFHNKFEDKIADGTPLANCSSADNPNLPGCVNFGSIYTQDTFSQLVNVDEAVTRGIELAGRWAFLPEWSVVANYTFTDSEQKSGPNQGQSLTNTPKHMLNTALNWDATTALRLWLRAEYRSERERYLESYADLSSGDQAIYDAVGDLKAYTVFHLGGAYKLSEKTTFNAAVYNVFDKDFLDGRAYADGYAPYYIQSGRSVTGTVEQGRRLWLSVTTEF